jgi:tetratricopeptide (TPR) repeat protein
MRAKPITICAALLMMWGSNVRADDTINVIENRWSEIRYAIKDRGAQLAAIKDLRTQIAALNEQQASADVLAWHALVLLLEADTRQSTASLGLAKHARNLLEEAAKIDTGVAGVLIHTTLGALYHEIPGWPIGFHDDGKARANFARALEIDAHHMDANYFYGDYLVQKRKYSEALPYLEKALTAPIRPDHVPYDTGRRAEVEESLALARQKLSQKSK